MSQIVRIKKPNKQTATEELEKLPKEELIARIQSLEAKNIQLQNIIHKSNPRSNPTSACTPPNTFDFTKCRFRHILLHLFYLGWDYQGFAVQENTTNTIEYNLFQALMKSCLIKDRSSSNYNRCGRTDKGVSSFGQVISIDVRSKLSNDDDDLDKEIDYCKVLNRLLPVEIQCIAWSPVPSSFSARFDCISRTYKYYFPKGYLNIEKMKEASKYLIGSHDFRNFAKMDVGNGVVQFVRNIFDFSIDKVDTRSDQDYEYSMYVARIRGNAFLWHQIRYMMGILFLVGANKEEPSVIKELLDVENNPRKPQYQMASEVPLNLFLCSYDDVEWRVNQESLRVVIEKYRQMGTISEVKTLLVRDILNELTCRSNDSGQFKCLSEYLVDGVKSKVHVPVMKRQKCESLEDKIRHFSKRQRIEVVSVNK